MGGFPFLLAHIKNSITGRAEPVDAACRFARHEAPVLPEVLAGAGTLAAVQTVNHGRRNTTCLQDQARNGFGERSRRAARMLGSLDLNLIRAPSRHLRLSDTRFELADHAF